MMGTSCFWKVVVKPVETTVYPSRGLILPLFPPPPPHAVLYVMLIVHGVLNCQSKEWLDPASTPPEVNYSWERRLRAEWTNRLNMANRLYNESKRLVTWKGG